MLFGLAMVFIPLVLGYFFKVSQPRIMRWVDRVVSAGLYIILLVIGISLGQLDDLGSKLPLIGHTAFGLSIVILSCNIIGIGFYDKFFPMLRAENQNGEKPSHWRMLWDSFRLIGTTVLGALVGYWTKGWLAFPMGTSTYAVMLMVFGVGIQLRNSGIPLRQVFFNQRGIHTALIFMVTSLLGGALAACYLDLPVMKGMAFASAFGWYSLSSVLVYDAWGAVDGSIAFFNDISREIVCLFLIPLLMPRLPSTAIGLGGATSLDCMLPVIQKSGGTQMVPLSISFGFITNLLPPILLSLFIHLAS